MMLAPGSRSLHRNHIWTMVLLLLLATALRLLAMGRVPPGLYHDEAYNGLDALRVLDGDLSLYFSANNGREPLFIYLVAFSVGLLGRSPFAVRLAAVAPGLLTVAATYALARILFGRRVGLLSAAVLSVTLWHFHLSRVGFRAVLLPLFIALTVWQGALGWRTGRRRHWLAAGVLYGLSFYTYLPARFTPLALLLFGLYLVVTRPRRDVRRYLAPLAWAGLALLLTLAPLALFTISHPDLVLGRTGQVSIWNAEINGGDFWGTLARHTTRTLGMFFAKGDRIWRHNVPWRPIFDPLLGAFFLIGLGRAVRGFRRNGAMAFLIIWTGTMTLPTLLAEDAPHFLRGVGVLPLVVLFPALGIDWLLRAARSSIPSARYAAGVAVCLALSFSLASASQAYFGDYAHADMTAYWFEDGAAALAGEINGFLGVGWDGARMQRGEPGDRRVYVEPVLWNAWTALPFLVAESPAVNLLPTNQPWPAVGSGPAAIFVWPYGDWRRVWPMLNSPAEIRVEEGARSQGDRDPEPYTTYLAFYATPVEAVPSALAHFEGGIELVGVSLESTASGVPVELLWHATASLADDFTVFVHYTLDGQRVAQDDAQPAGGHYPTSRWQPGDLIHDQHLISLPLGGTQGGSGAQLVLGLYRAEDGQPLNVLDQAGNPAGTSVTIPINEIIQ
jgi:4-amino-4-deoxy-L-arabinose transferase-like glycosyltransferase